MYKNIEELKEISKDLERIFGVETTEKVWSHFTSMFRKIEDLEKSRDNLKNKCKKLQEKEN